MTDDVALLVERALGGDPAAADRLVRLHMGAAYAVALAVTRNPHEAEDVAQDALVLALERLSECRDPRKFGGWLVRIVRNRAFNHRRYLGIRAAEPLEHADAAPGASTPLEETERAELRDRLNDAVGELPQTQREVLLLHDLEGWTHREIAERMGLPPGTVRSHLHHARRHVRALLPELEDWNDG